MTAFTILYLSRSDGKTKYKEKLAMENNQPTVKQLDSTPNAKGISDYYREIASSETKHTDWRRKLAGMLARELGVEGHELKAFILEEFPANYRLFEHVKSKATDASGNPTKNTKTHAGGGHDRQDAYLYGHPLGRKKRYRSPADFFPHLYWLATDADGDPHNCRCKVCSPDELQQETKAELKAEQAEKKAAQVKKEVSEPKSPAAPYRGPVVEIRVPANPNANNANIATKRAGSTSTPTQPTTPLPPVTTPLPQPRSTDQQIDAAYGRYTFRPGELVWFDRSGGESWALGIVVRRWMISSVDPSKSKAYLMQPISHPFDNLAQKVIQEETRMRPWLAWSPPGYMHTGLNNTNVTYETADWHGISTGAFGPQQDMTIDGSILAAKSIDKSYTPFDFVKRSPPDQTHWNGIYMGAEKLWVGDAARLRASQDESVIVIYDIIESPAPQSMSGPVNQTQIRIVGDTYTVAIHTPQTLATASLGNDRGIPQRMKEDMKLRNQISTRAQGGPVYHWKLIQPRLTTDLHAIKGRWYEWSTLSPILKAQNLPGYHEDLRRGKVESLSGFLNPRVDCTGRSPGNRKATREEAFGRAVPDSVKVREGVDAPNARELPVETPLAPPQPPPQREVQTQSQQLYTGPIPGSQEAPVELDEFMNLDGIDENALPGFGHEFGGQDGFYR